MMLYDAQRGRGYASGYWLDGMAAIDIAVYDAIGRREGVPVAAMLCDTPRTQLPVYLSGLRRRTPCMTRHCKSGSWATI